MFRRIFCLLEEKRKIWNEINVGRKTRRKCSKPVARRLRRKWVSSPKRNRRREMAEGRRSTIQLSPSLLYPSKLYPKLPRRVGLVRALPLFLLPLTLPLHRHLHPCPEVRMQEVDCRLCPGEAANLHSLHHFHRCPELSPLLQLPVDCRPCLELEEAPQTREEQHLPPPRPSLLCPINSQLSCRKLPAYSIF